MISDVTATCLTFCHIWIAPLALGALGRSIFGIVHIICIFGVFQIICIFDIFHILCIFGMFHIIWDWFKRIRKSSEDVRGAFKLSFLVKVGILWGSDQIGSFYQFLQIQNLPVNGSNLVQLGPISKGGAGG